MGKSQRTKGYRGEKECVDLLRGMGFNATRTALLQAGADSQNIKAPDVMADILKLHINDDMDFTRDKLAFDIECKLGKQVGTTIYKWYAQAEECDHIGNAMPLLYMRRDHEQGLWVMKDEVFERLVKA